MIRSKELNMNELERIMNVLLDQNMTLINQNIHQVKKEVADLRVKVSDLEKRQSTDEVEKARRQAILKTLWRYRTFILASIITLLGVVEGAKALYYAEPPSHKTTQGS